MTLSPLASYARDEGWLGHEVRTYAEVTSTNDLAMEAGRAGAAAGLVILADRQTAGKGRLGRRWEAPVGTCLLVSILFRPQAPFAYHASRTTMACGLALMEAVREVTGIPAELKWPNDLIVTSEGGWSKLAGMLSEIGLDEAGQPDFLVVGIGLNVNVPAEALAGLAPNATSLLVLGRRRVPRSTILDPMLAGIEQRHAQLVQGEDLLPAWQASLAWMGEGVEVRTAGEIVTGIASGVDEDGGLLLRSADGRMRSFSAGDVTVRRS